MLLPVELIDRIFSFLQGDILTLKACSKAHSLYSRLAERYLYADIFVVTNDRELYKQLSGNSHILDYPRTLEIHTALASLDLTLSIILMIPQMPNLMSLSLYGMLDICEDSVSTFRNCFQQSSIEQLHLQNCHGFPFSVLDNAKSIKKLTLSHCSAIEEPLSEATLPIETLKISGTHNQRLLLWTSRRVTKLHTLELRAMWESKCPQLLGACSNSLRMLHLDVMNHCMWYTSIKFSDLHLAACIGRDIYFYDVAHRGESAL